MYIYIYIYIYITLAKTNKERKVLMENYPLEIVLLYF